MLILAKIVRRSPTLECTSLTLDWACCGRVFTLGFFSLPGLAGPPGPPPPPFGAAGVSVDDREIATTPPRPGTEVDVDGSSRGIKWDLTTVAVARWSYKITISKYELEFTSKSHILQRQKVEEIRILAVARYITACVCLPSKAISERCSIRFSWISFFLMVVVSQILRSSKSFGRGKSGHPIPK